MARMWKWRGLETLDMRTVCDEAYETLTKAWHRKSGSEFWGSDQIVEIKLTDELLYVRCIIVYG